MTNKWSAMEIFKLNKIDGKRALDDGSIFNHVEGNQTN